MRISFEARKRKIADGKIKTWNEGLYGDKSHSWQGGLSFDPYTSAFNKKFKIVIRKRDNYVCTICGIHNEKLKQPLCVHHINYDKNLSIPENCVSLCHTCHGKTNHNRKHWMFFLRNVLIEKYKYSYDAQNIVIRLEEEKGGKVEQ